MDNSLTFEQTWWNKNVENRYAEIKSWWGNSTSDSIVYFANYIKFKGYTNILDVGCGYASLYEAIVNNKINIDYTGVDTCGYLVRMNTRKNIKTITNDARKLVDISDSSFDTVFMRHVIEHQPNYIDTLNELIRVAKFEIGIVFFIKPSDTTHINFNKEENLYMNTYNKKEMEATLRSNPKVRSWIWINNNSSECTLHIYIKKSQ